MGRQVLVYLALAPARQFGRNRAVTRFPAGIGTRATAGIHGSEAESECSVPAHAAAAIETRQLTGHNPARFAVGAPPERPGKWTNSFSVPEHIPGEPALVNRSNPAPAL